MSREEAIEILSEMRAEYNLFGDEEEATRYHVLSWAIQAMKAAQRWIPVSERLPKENGRYFVTRGLNACGALWNRVYIINYSDLMGLKSEKIWWNGNVGKSDFEEITDVVAWMPLPEPYKEGKDERT